MLLNNPLFSKRRRRRRKNSLKRVKKFNKILTNKVLIKKKTNSNGKTKQKYNKFHKKSKNQEQKTNKLT